jgi:outer membrane protein OmpA-like peptidoglycan-associated protein
MAALVPALGTAQQRPAQPPAQRPAQQPAQRPAQRPAPMAAQRSGAIILGIAPVVFIARDEALFGHLSNNVAAQADDPSEYLPGAVGSVAYSLTPNIAVGVGVGVGFTSGLLLLQPSAGVGYTFSPANRWSPYVIASGGGSMWSGDGPSERATGIGGYGTLGLRYMWQENLALRVEGRVGYENYSDEEINAIVGRAGVGLSYIIGGGPPRDTDGDGVADRRDRCANTPRGATVDARGCPSDSDNDGVYNGLDRCPDTPRGTPVDASGCTRDSDRDGIADNLDRCANTPSGVRVDANGCPVDTDRDGVPDHQDRCADTPAGVPVDANGCPRDSDGDGVTDNNDRCPNTAAGTTVDANGCPRDSDGDGVTDNNDRCPNTSAGTQVDPTGCPVQRDADGDGVIDANDRCANTPAGRRVDASGCELAELPTEVGSTLVLRNITFAAGTSRLAPTARPILDRIATSINSFLQATPGASFEIGGHTDNRGSPAANTRLSQARAQSVLDYLVSRGVPRDKLRAVGYGPGQPVAPNTTAAGRAQNRRVEIKRTQ